MEAPGWLLRWSVRQAYACKRLDQAAALARETAAGRDCGHDELEVAGGLTRCCECGRTIARRRGSHPAVVAEREGAGRW
jgi:hypothetical protein